MKKLTVLIFTIVFLSISSMAMAGKDSGFYVGASLGNTSLDIAMDDISGGIDFDDNDMGFKVFAGYNFGLIPMFDFAVEGSYVDFGEISTPLPEPFADLDFGLTAYDIFGVACYNIGPFGIFGKVGHAWWETDSSFPSLDVSSSDMAYGLGLRFQFSSLAVRAEYEIFDLEGDIDLDYFSVGVSWTF